MRAPTRLPLALAIAIAFAGTAPRLSAQDSVKVLRPTSDLITREQIDGVKATNAYDVIEALHSNWLRERLPVPSDRNTSKMDSTGRAQYTADMQPGGRSAPQANGGIQVYLDGSRLGGLDQLKNIRAPDIYSIRRISGPDAQARYGMGHSSGVLFLSTLTYGLKENP